MSLRKRRRQYPEPTSMNGGYHLADGVESLYCFPEPAA
jgi:hypothetical protein